jgi:hypothetical protein
MPGTPTTNYSWPLPAPTDPPDVPGDMANLANAIDATLFGIASSVLGSISSLNDSVDDINLAIVDIYSKIPTAKVKWGSVNVDFNASGHGTLVHSAGWTPSVGVFTPDTGGETMVVINMRHDLTPTASSVFLKGWFLNGTEDPAGSGLYKSRVYTGLTSIKYILRD